MDYQIYALDKNGKLTHAGVHRINKPVTKGKIVKIEKAWRKWRKQYLQDNPGDYPLRHSQDSAEYRVHPVGHSNHVLSVPI